VAALNLGYDLQEPMAQKIHPGSAALVLAGALPVHLTVLAPGELVAAQPVVLRAPLDGVIDKVHVQPNQMVRKGQPCLDWMRPRSAVAWKLLSRHC
jgi:multidrug efflux pump subunit AcrA (membrane-fusion protein)